MLSLRGRLALLVVAHAGHLLGSGGLALLLLPRLVPDLGTLTAALAAIGLVLSVPVLGWVVGVVPRRDALVAGALLGPLGVGAAAVGASGYVALVGLGLGTLLFHTAGFALLPVATRDARVSLPRFLGWLHAGRCLALLAVLWLVPLAPEGPLPTWLIGVQLLAALAAFGARFPSDRPAAETPAALGRVLARPRARRFLLGLAGGVALLAAGVPIYRGTFSWLLGGLTAGGLLAAWQRNPWRSPGLVPLAAFASFVALGLTWFVGAGTTLAFLFGTAAGLGLVPLLATYLAALPADARATGAALVPVAGLAGAAALLGLDVGVLALVALAATALAGYLLLPPLVEQVLEFVGPLLARIRVVGPGADDVPLDGPLVLVCNHTAYLDPVWVGKVVPRKVVAMMTSVFYDLPIVRWLMVHVAHAIRVPAATFRREAPELQDAIRVLQAGGCLLIFPEARLRKTEEKLLYPFGQGLWHILRAVPNARVVAVWIEGGWGSWTSYGHGAPPFRGKPVDWRRKIELGMSPAEPVPAELLADREAFRLWLMQRVLACRAYLGLPVPTVEQALGRDVTTENNAPHQIDSETDGDR